MKGRKRAKSESHAVLSAILVTGRCLTDDTTDVDNSRRIGNSKNWKREFQRMNGFRIY